MVYTYIHIKKVKILVKYLTVISSKVLHNLSYLKVTITRYNVITMDISVL